MESNEQYFLCPKCQGGKFLRVQNGIQCEKCRAVISNGWRECHQIGVENAKDNSGGPVQKQG